MGDLELMPNVMVTAVQSALTEQAEMVEEETGTLLPVPLSRGPP